MRIFESPVRNLLGFVPIAVLVEDAMSGWGSRNSRRSSLPPPGWYPGFHGLDEGFGRFEVAGVDDAV